MASTYISRRLSSFLYGLHSLVSNVLEGFGCDILVVFSCFPKADSDSHAIFHCLRGTLGASRQEWMRRIA